MQKKSEHTKWLNKPKALKALWTGVTGPPGVWLVSSLPESEANWLIMDTHKRLQTSTMRRKQPKKETQNDNKETQNSQKEMQNDYKELQNSQEKMQNGYRDEKWQQRDANNPPKR